MVPPAHAGGTDLIAHPALLTTTVHCPVLSLTLNPSCYSLAREIQKLATVLVRAESTQSKSSTTRESINVQAFFFKSQSMHRAVAGLLDHVPGFCASDRDDRFGEDSKQREECIH